jgi:hypothetical protein
MFLGAMIEGNPGRYMLPYGALGASAPAGNALGTGASDDGTTIDFPELEYTLDAVARPLTRERTVQIVVRAVKGGVEEQNGDEYLVKFDGAGDIIAAKPNEASIQKLDVSAGLTIACDVVVHEDDTEAAAITADLYVVALGSSISMADVPQATAAFGSSVGGIKRKTLSYTVGAAGFYRVAGAVRDTNGRRSATFKERIVYIEDTEPGDASGISAWIQRGRPPIQKA